jgi:FAD/FMN-containing dehydrogenase
VVISRPANVKELSDTLAKAFASSEKVLSLDLSALDRVLEHAPEDMTATVEGGITLGQLQEQLGRHGQWLPIDPPNAESVTISHILNANCSGPRRFGYGTIREHLIGIKVVLADGRIIKAGGKVVKNVAGYDLCKIFVGSQGTLGVIVEASFKLRPLPAAEQFVQARCDSLAHAADLLDAVLESELMPVVLDLHNLSTPNSTSGHSEGPGSIYLVLGLAGTKEEVQWQLAKSMELGFIEKSDLYYERIFWSPQAGGTVHSRSTLPSRLIQTLGELGAVSFVARAGNGAIVYRGGTKPAKSDLPLALMRRLKEIYDPKNILPEFAL